MTFMRNNKTSKSRGNFALSNKISEKQFCEIFKPAKKTSPRPKKTRLCDDDSRT